MFPQSNQGNGDEQDINTARTAELHNGHNELMMGTQTGLTGSISLRSRVYLSSIPIGLPSKPIGIL